LTDRYLSNKDEAVDVIIPLINTNELFERNLFNYYERIPINHLLIGDGGCTDDSLSIALKFPRVKVFNHRHFLSQGGSIIDLIKNVQTDVFIYLHADAFLPEGWYETMINNKNSYDWYECPQRLTTLIEFDNREAERAFSGAQMGKKSFFDIFIKHVEDDYLQRNEDIILAEMVEKHGGKYGKVHSTYHYHQVMDRKDKKEPKFESVSIKKKADKDWEIRIFEMQYKGIIKYLPPSKTYLINEVNNSLEVLADHGVLRGVNVIQWVEKVNPLWLPYVRKGLFIIKLRRNLRSVYRWLFRLMKITVIVG